MIYTVGLQYQPSLQREEQQALAYIKEEEEIEYKEPRLSSG